MRTMFARARRGYITQLVEALTRPRDASNDAEIEMELENQLGMEIDQALGTQPVDAAEADVRR